KLISDEAVARMKKGSVIVDLASDTGGNCNYTVEGEKVLYDGILIIGESKFFKRTPKSASTLLGNNFQKFIEHLVKNNDNLLNDEIIQETLVIQQGEIVNEKILKEVNDI